MPEYPTNHEMIRHFWGLAYYYRINGNSISIEHVYPGNDGALHNNYEYGSIQGDSLILTHTSSGRTKKHLLPRKKIFVYNPLLTASRPAKRSSRQGSSITKSFELHLVLTQYLWPAGV